LAGEDVDVILLDQKLPDMDGCDLLKRLKSDKRVHDIPVIVLSSLEERQSAIECIQRGAEDYLSKPVDQVLLMARIGACLERQRLKDQKFEQFFPPEIVRQLRYREDLFTGRELDVTILFCDIRGFSRISEPLSPASTVQWVSDVMEKLSNSVIHHHGVLVDYIGDELMAMWGAPEKQDDAEKLACGAALDMLNQLPELNKKWQGQIGEAMDLGIGIHTGKAHVGNVGSRRRFKYGPLGSTVNLASRVQGAVKYMRSRILLTQATAARMQDAPVLRRLGKVRVVNIQMPVEVYELSPHRANWSDLKVGYEKALGECEQQNFLAAICRLGKLMEKYPDDGPCDLLLSRAVSLRQNPSAKFDGVLLDLLSK
jgi:adenylate cyclase